MPLAVQAGTASVNGSYVWLIERDEEADSIPELLKAEEDVAQ